MALLLKTVTAGKRWMFVQFDYQLLGFAEGERPIVINVREDASLVCYDASIKRPYAAPVVAAAAGTNLSAGDYDVVWAYYRSLDNIYSAISPSATQAITAGANEAILVSTFQAPENKAWPLTDSIDQIRIFISPPNFGQFYFPNTTDTIIDIKTQRKADGATFATLPSAGNTTGDIRRVAADNLLYKWSGSAWAVLSVTYDQTDDTLRGGIQADLFEWEMLPGVRHGARVGDRILLGGQSTKTGVGTCTITNESFAGATRAKVVLASDTITDGMIWRKFVVNGTIVGRVFYTDASPFDGTTFYLKDPWRGATITAETDYRWEGDQYVWSTSNINIIANTNNVPSVFPQCFNPESFLGPELELGDQDEIRDIVGVGNSAIVGQDSKFIRIDVGLDAGSFREAGVIGLVALEKNLGTISYFSGARARQNQVTFLGSSGLVTGTENGFELITDQLANRQYFRDRLNRTSFVNARGVFVEHDYRDYYVLYYAKDSADSTFTQCLLFDLAEGRLIPYDIGRQFTEVLQINDANGAPVALYGDASGNIGFFLKASTFTNNGTNYVSYWQSGASDYGTPAKKSIGGIVALQLFRDTSYSLTVNVYGLGNNYDLDNLPTPQARTITQSDEGYRINIPFTKASELLMVRLTANAADWPKYVSRVEFDLKQLETVR